MAFNLSPVDGEIHIAPNGTRRKWDATRKFWKKLPDKDVYNFSSLADIGVYEVPVGAKIVVENFDNGQPLEIIKTSEGTLNQASDVATLLSDPALYKRTGIQNNTNGTTRVVYQVWAGSQAEYDALGVYDPTVLYFIRE